MGRLDGKVVMISGGARGQGEAEARLFVAEGARVVLGDVRDAEGEAVAASLGSGALYVHLDVRQQDDWTLAVAKAKEHYGSLNGLINNAGVTRDTNVLTTSVVDYLDVINVNQVGTYLGMKECAPAIIAAGGGSIVNISSMMGFIGGENRIAYTASKFAVRGMTKAAALELGPYGVRVNSIHPGAIDTDMIAPQVRPALPYDKLPLRRIGRADEVANLALFLISDESSYSTGSEFVIDGGWMAGP